MLVNLTAGQYRIRAQAVGVGKPDTLPDPVPVGDREANMPESQRGIGSDPGGVGRLLLDESGASRLQRAAHQGGWKMETKVRAGDSRLRRRWLPICLLLAICLFLAGSQFCHNVLCGPGSHGFGLQRGHVIG